MKVGDLVGWHIVNSESRMAGIIVGWSDHQNSDPREGRRDPIVLWADGRVNWVVRRRVDVINASW
jgi:hypothetical protein